ncbi:hypothetical protein B0O99DRAFT_517557 [Bisporella sp. PMI_857]|nr:hypothetical protein B0O99DRAFT_517557 [Bisporella sp. PMI_857]
MATNNLLDPAPEESFNGSVIEVDKRSVEDILEPSKSKTQTITPSEIARVAVLEAQEVAEDDRYHKQLILSNLQDEFEGWKYHYEEELRKYRLDVEDGIAELEMTAFDNFMLQEHQELSKNLTKAEKEFEEADGKAKALRIVQPANGYFQGSHSDRSLGYNSLDEATWIAHVDRDFIHRWLHTIDKTEVGQVQVSDCDEWEVKTVELGDSISLVAEGVERKNINRWMSIQIRRNELVSLSSGDIFAES